MENQQQAGAPRTEAGAIRAARAGDERALHALICALEEHDFPFDAFCERLRAQAADGRHTCLVYEEAGQVLGMLNMRIEPQLHHERPTAEILELVVDTAQRSHGVGAALFAAAREQAAHAGCEQLELASNARRVDAHRFYERQGMTKSHVHFTMPL